MSRDKYIYKKNVKYIENHKPQISRHINNAQIDELLSAEKAENGQYTFTYSIEDKKAPITSEINPSQYAKDLVARLLDNDIGNKQINKTVAILFVMDPYILEEFCSQYEHINDVFVIFPSLDYFYSLLHYYDFTTLLKMEKFKPIPSNDIKSLERSISVNIQRPHILAAGIRLISFSPFDHFFGETLDSMRKGIQAAIRLSASNIATNIVRGEMIRRNDLKSLDKFIQYPDISIVYDKVKGKPIICVAAGPSLNKDLKTLKKIQDDVFIVAASAVLKTLRKHGIKPDIITTLDMTPLIKKYLDDVDVKNDRIAIEMSCYHGILDEIKSNYILSVAAMTGRNYIRDFLGALGIEIDKKYIIQGAMTVAFMSLQIALKLGTNTVILLGQDLAYGGETHVSGASYTAGVNIVEVKGKEFFYFEEFTGIKNAYVPVVWVKGINKDKVPTTEQLENYRLLLERLIKHGQGVRIINCAREGSYIEGAEHMTLEKAYDTFIKDNKVDKTKVNIPKRRKYDFTKLPERMKTFDEFIRRFTEVRDIAQEGLDDMKEFETLDSENPNDHLRRQVLAKRINMKILKITGEYKKELKYIESNQTAEVFLLRMINNANKTKFTDVDHFADMKNKTTLLFSTCVDDMTLFIDELSAMVARVRKKYKKYFADDGTEE